jgi:pentatricopeptide repeat protein
LLGSRGAHDTMLRYLDHLSSSSPQTSLQDNGVFWYTASIGALTKSPKYRGKALGLLDKMDRLDIVPNAYTFTALFTGIHGRQNTLKLMERASSYGTNVEWNIHFYNAAIHACSRQHPDSSKDERHDHQGWQTALTLFRQMQQQEVEPNDQTYTWLLHACAKSGQVRVALSLLEELRASGTRPSEAVWGAALRACAMAGNYMEAMNLIQTMQSDQGGVPPSTLHYNTLLSALSKTGQDTLAHDILQSMQTSTTPSKNISVQQHVSGSNEETSVEISSIHEGARPDIISLNTVLGAFAKAGNYDGARKLISRMEEGEFWQDVQHQNEGFQYPRANRRVAIQPDVISYNTLLSACSDPMEAVKIVQEVRYPTDTVELS